MNLLEELDGLQGENLASAALRFLVLQSNPCKNALLETLNKVSPIGPLTSTSHFSCYREYATSSEESGAGRLDLVLELDQAVVGIEAKLLAEFQPEQPTKYKEDIE
ncbi:PD-(D/E)XK nuclease family protein, partial [Candidatus Sumerlaeota bacterium]|nr:PD-(D/E)XK nuclease family protein [Candidatus Sumerlaeota bacterium]